MPILTDETLDTLTAGKSKYLPVTLKQGVVEKIEQFAKTKKMSKSDALNRIVAEWEVLRKQAEAAETEIV